VVAAIFSWLPLVAQRSFVTPRIGCRDRTERALFTNLGGWPKPAPTSTSKLKTKNVVSRHPMSRRALIRLTAVWEATLLIVLAISLWLRWRG